MEKAAKAYEISQRLRHDADNGMFDGKDGKSAYIDALTAGYKGTENEFCEGLANMPGHISDKNIHVTAQDKENWDGKAAANPNLLDNWYFKYPINQRGKTTYDTSRESAYTIDRWWAIFAGVTVSSDGIVLQSNLTVCIRRTTFPDTNGTEKRLFCGVMPKLRRIEGRWRSMYLHKRIESNRKSYIRH